MLVLHGTADTIMSPSDSRAISDIVNRAHPGHATYADIQDADHLLAVHDKLEEHVVPAMIDWMRKQLGPRGRLRLVCGAQHLSAAQKLFEFLFCQNRYT